MVNFPRPPLSKNLFQRLTEFEYNEYKCQKDFKNLISPFLAFNKPSDIKGLPGVVQGDQADQGLDLNDCTLSQ